MGARKVAGDVDQHGAGATGGGDVEGLAECAGEVVARLQQETVLDHGHGDADNVGFLECVRADDAACDLAGDNHQGHGIHKGGCDAGYGVGGARPAGDQDYADFAGCARVAVRHVRGALLVAGQHVANLL